jgi:hypothetical protein
MLVICNDVKGKTKANNEHDSRGLYQEMERRRKDDRRNKREGENKKNFKIISVNHDFP